MNPFDEIAKNEKAIRAAYRRLAKKCHPDLRADKEKATSEFRELTTQYEAALAVAAGKPSKGRPYRQAKPSPKPPPTKPAPPPPPPPPKNAPEKVYKVEMIGTFEIEDFGAAFRNLAVPRHYGVNGGRIRIMVGFHEFYFDMPKGTKNGQTFRFPTEKGPLEIKFVFDDIYQKYAAHSSSL